MYANTEALFAEISTELGLSEARAKRFQAFDPETGATIFFATMDEMVAFVEGL